MSKYVTRVSVWFYSEGASPSQVINSLLELGFRPVRGAYDFVYVHGPDMTSENLSGAIIEISNALHKALSGFKVLFNLDTRLSDSDDDYVPLEDIDAELAETRKEIEQIENDEAK